MSGIKVNVLWSPNHSDRFITFGTDLHLYKVEEIKDSVIKTSSVKISKATCATLLSTNSENQYMKCVSWYPKPQHDHLLAVGQANGRVVLTSFEDNLDHFDLAGREFVPRHSRQCNCVAWNPVECHLLASGMDKCRTDYGVLIWDVMKPLYAASIADSCSSLEKRHAQSSLFSSDSSSIVSKPIVELGMSEVAHSLHWFSNTPKIIVCGMNNKHIKIYDLRDSTKHQNSTPTKAVYGVCVDPFFEHRLASFVENVVVMWDVRNFEKPVLTLHESKHILKLGWSPARNNLLAALPRDSSFMKLYEIQQACLGNDEVEPAIVERSIKPFEDHVICSFAWHPNEENRMLTVTPDNKIQDYTVFDRITLNWSPRSEVVWTYGRKTLKCVDYRDEFFNNLQDISLKMRKRAGLGYGLEMKQASLNGNLSDDPNLVTLWTWLDMVKSIDDEKFSESRICQRFEGLYSVICNENGNTRNHSEVFKMPWIGLKSTSAKISKYVSEERKKAIQMCGWNYDANFKCFDSFLDSLQVGGNYSRAAALAVFHLEIRRAIQLLNEGGAVSRENSIDLTALAMALAGCTEDKNALSREIVGNLKSQLTDPHLRAMFAFVTSEGDGYEEIILADGMSNQDKIAFACMYLPDKKLADFLSRLKNKLTDEGNICGILVTGLSSDGLSLLQNYVDITGDVQTASMVLLHTLPSQFAHDSRAQLWVESYRQLLDYWCLWKQRAMFDVEWFKANPVNKPQQQVFVSCNFCGKSVSNYIQLHAPSQGARFSQLATTQGNKSKVTCCPGCRKPLPRCSLCLSHMGTPAGLHWRQQQDGRTDKKLTEFSNWLTWCQSCRHGGHSIHILEWFKEHTECTVTGCTCKCMSLDGTAKLGFKLSECS